MSSARCEPITQTDCLGLLPYNQTYYPNTASANQSAALQTYSDLSPLASCHGEAPIMLCSALFPQCIHNGPTFRPCREICEQVESACSSAFVSATGYDWPVSCAEFNNELPVEGTPFCLGPEGGKEDFENFGWFTNIYSE